MNLHSGARSCPASRALLVGRVRQAGWTLTRAAEAARISRRTAHKWQGRHVAAVAASLADRSLRPRRSPGRTPTEWQEMILLLRRTKMTGPRIARDLKRPQTTVARVLERAGLERPKKLDVPSRRTSGVGSFRRPRVGRLGCPSTESISYTLNLSGCAEHLLCSSPESDVWRALQL